MVGLERTVVDLVWSEGLRHLFKHRDHIFHRLRSIECLGEPDLKELV
jgi:hypothetical protein